MLTIPFYGIFKVLTVVEINKCANVPTAAKQLKNLPSYLLRKQFPSNRCEILLKNKINIKTKFTRKFVEKREAKE